MKTTNQNETKQIMKKKHMKSCQGLMCIYTHTIFYFGGYQNCERNSVCKLVLGLRECRSLILFIFSSSFIFWCLDTIFIPRVTSPKSVQCRQEGLCRESYRVPEWTLASPKRVLQADIDKHELPSWGWFGLG